MDRYLCEPCGYVYDPKVGDPDHDIPAGTAFEDLPDDWVCPWCGLGKDVFVPAKTCRVKAPVVLHWKKYARWHKN